VARPPTCGSPRGDAVDPYAPPHRPSRTAPPHPVLERARPCRPSSSSRLSRCDSSCRLRRRRQLPPRAALPMNADGSGRHRHDGIDPG
jgi:hypothetical protein